MNVLAALETASCRIRNTEPLVEGAQKLLCHTVANEVDEARAAIEGLIAVAEKVLGCGTWHYSALEIDVYAKTPDGLGYDGDALEEELTAALHRVRGTL